MNGQLALAKFLHLAWSHWVSTDKGKKYVLPISLKIESMQHMVWLLSNYTDHSCICGHVIQSITMTRTKTSWMNKTMKELISKILHSKIILTVFQACHHHDYSSLYPMKWANIKRLNEFSQNSYHHDECTEGLCQDHSNAFILDLQHGDHSRCHMASNTVLHYADFLFHILALFLQYSPLVLLIQALWMVVIGLVWIVL